MGHLHAGVATKPDFKASIISKFRVPLAPESEKGQHNFLPLACLVRHNTQCMWRLYWRLRQTQLWIPQTSARFPKNVSTTLNCLSTAIRGDVLLVEVVLFFGGGGHSCSCAHRCYCIPWGTLLPWRSVPHPMCLGWDGGSHARSFLQAG